MELLSLTLTGYKRFKATTSLQTNGKLIALLGPNESGKSSLLDAIAHLAHGEAISLDEQSRDIDPNNLKIVGQFFLNESELAAAGLPGPRKMIVTKSADGGRTFGFEPDAPVRDTSHRKSLVAKLSELGSQPEIVTQLDQSDEELGSEMTALAGRLNNSSEKLASDILAMLKDIASRLREALSDSQSSQVQDFLVQLDQAIELEASPTPLDRASTALKGRVPQMLLFDEDQRDLASNYSISQLRQEIPQALLNLAEVANLCFPSLFDAIDAGLTSKITTIERNASRTLSEKFGLAWKQSGLGVALRIQGDVLEVQIVNAETEFTPLAERSDGLRQFVALQMFATRNHIDQPVLLIDEADQRLHYDAQADLVQMLARQQLAPKVIYTTHSAGCLPEDLGNGVRTIVPSTNGSSRIVNRFWSSKRPGLTPLLIGLGASTMAFFPTRRAVMVEGPSDMLLYPTLFREALEVASLGFQFVPGLAKIEKEQALAVGNNVLYLVDGDGGGKAIKKQLVDELGIPKDDVYVLQNKSGSAVELEDFVSEEHLIEAANAILKKWHPNANPITMIGSVDGTRMSNLEHLFKQIAGVDLPKVDLAYALLEVLDTNPLIRLLDPRRLNAVKTIATTIIKRFEARNNSADVA